MRILRFLSIIVFISTTQGLVQGQVKVTFNINSGKQTIEGFGGSIAFYENWVTAHPYKSKMYDYLFRDLGISILRIRNSYYNEGGTNQGMTDLKNIIAEAKKRNPIDIMISSWAPAGKYKSNGKPANDGTMATLATDSTGQFVYDGFANWWYQSLLQYQSMGINAKYISIQNEPNWHPSYEGCIFMPTEQQLYDAVLDSTYKVASYTKAFNKVHDLLDSNRTKLTLLPKMIGPEVLGIEDKWSGRPLDYTSQMDMSKCDAMAHHLYTGGNDASPSSFNSNLSKLANYYPNISKMQTEYSNGDWFSTAQVVLNSLVYENVNAYLVWDLVWPGSDFINMENPWTSGSWVNQYGFKVGPEYYAFKQFTAFIKPGWRRVNATSSSSSVTTAAFISPDYTRAAVVLINTSTVKQNFTLEPYSFQVDSGKIYRTSATENCAYISGFTFGNLGLPAQSITTLSLYGSFDISGKTIALQFPVNGQFLINDQATGKIMNNGGVTINSPYQYFEVKRLSDSTVALLNAGNGKYLSWSADSAVSVMADADSTGLQQQFKLAYHADGSLSLITSSTGKFVYVEGAPAYTAPQVLNSTGDSSTQAGRFNVKVLSPSVRISSPLNGSNYQDSIVKLTIKAEAGDPDGSIASIELYAGDEKIGESTSGTLTVFWPVDSSGNYTFTAIAHDNTGLSAQSNPVTVSVEIVHTAINNLAAGSICVYPNPCSNSVHIDLGSGSRETKIRISDLQGKQVFHSLLPASGNLEFGNNLPAGIYILQVEDGISVQRLKLIKQ